MKLALASATVALGFINSVHGYAVVAEPSCDALLICETITGNEATAELDENGDVVECKFGQTSLETDEFGFCEGPCEGFEFFDCACATEQQRKDGLKAEAYLDTLFGSLGLVCLFIAGLIQGIYEKKYRDKQELFTEKQNAAKGDETKIDMLPPKPPNCCCFCVFYILFIVLMLIGFINMIIVRTRDYWVGCGEDGDGFFRDEYSNNSGLSALD